MRAGQLVGIISRADLVQPLASTPGEPTLDVLPTGREIREALMHELKGQPWAFAGRNVVVRAGVGPRWGILRSVEAVRAVWVEA